jgi:hypothetical protein
MEKQPSRRLFSASSVEAASIFGALGVATMAEAAPSTMKMLSERLWAIERNALAFGTDEECEATADATSELVDRIVSMPAKTLEDFRVKARALSWCYSGDIDIDLFEDCPQNTTDVQIARSILRDLLAVDGDGMAPQ